MRKQGDVVQVTVNGWQKIYHAEHAPKSSEPPEILPKLPVRADYKTEEDYMEALSVQCDGCSKPLWTDK